MDSKNNDFKGFENEDLDPLVFVETNDSPELRAEALAIPRPVRDEHYEGPKKSRVELITDNSEQIAYEWVPTKEEFRSSHQGQSLLQLVYNNLGKVILFVIPIGLITGFLYYASIQL